MKNAFLSISMLLIASLSFAQVDHSSWDELLSKNVSKTGLVKYAGFRKNKQKLINYLDSLSVHVPTEEASRNAKKAFWINAYNAHTVKLILDHYPVRSINDIKLSGATPTSTRYIKMGNETLSLSDIENKKLKGIDKDLRIHFILNNGSLSCPVLFNSAITEENIEETLEAQTKSFINDKTRNMVTRKSVRISSLFEWYQYEFGDVIDFYNKYAKTKIPSEKKIAYMPYSWDLNE